MKNKIVIIVVCVLIIIFGIVILCFLNKDNNNNENNITKDAALANISFNGLKIGNKIDEEMKKLVLDAEDYKYEYNNIFINADSNDNIFYLGFFSSDITIRDVNIEYDGSKLETISDFRDMFGNGLLEKSEYNSEDYYIKYYDDDNLELSLFIRDDEIYNVLSRKVKQINKIMPQYKAIRGIIITERALIKTTTNKIKRQANLDAIEETKN